MSSRPPPAQGEIWFVDLAGAEGREQAGDRPALVLSVNELNRTGLSLVVPGTTRKKPLPGAVMVPAGVGGLSRDTWFMCNQLRTIDHRRIRRRVGRLGLTYLHTVALATSALIEVPDAEHPENEFIDGTRSGR
ncbi:MAG TPA: type II toxin-antitoxin system PemK/MazF family toxin, partial [Longimicrobiaceae bacterium]|nr:type II toxin-antitoxin system PemK/MazF family toxin [Longimicrobiaceae bacterium]